LRNWSKTKELDAVFWACAVIVGSSRVALD
jgi:hypothetical protein